MAASRNRSVAIVTVGALLQMVVQFVLQLVLAHQFGAGVAMDAFVASTTVPLVVGGMITVPLGAVLIPSLSRTQASESPEAALRLAGQSGLVFGSLTLVIAAAIAWQARLVTGLVFPGLSGEELVLSAQLLAVLAWLIPANTLTMFFQSFQNWQGRFFLPALAGVLGPAVTVGFVIVFAPRWGIPAVAWGVVAGAAVNVLIQTTGVRSIRWARPSGPALRSLAALMGPLLLGSMYLRLEPLVDRSLASTLETGVISYLGYTWRLINAILALTSGALSVVAFPYLSAAAAKDRSELAAEVSRTLGMLTFVVVPFVAAFGVFAPDIVRDLFQRGEFTATDTAQVARLLRWSLGIVIGASIGEITARAFYASHSVWPPILIGAGLLTFGILGKVVLVSDLGAVALVAVSSVAYCLSAAVQLGLLRKRLGPATFAGLGRAVGVSVVCAGVACLVGGAVTRLPLPVPSLWGGLAGGAIFIAIVGSPPARVWIRTSQSLYARLRSRD